MSNHDDSLQATPKQHLEALMAGGDREGRIWDVLHLEFDQHLGADRYESTVDRRGYRHGPGHQNCGWLLPEPWSSRRSGSPATAI